MSVLLGRRAAPAVVFGVAALACALLFLLAPARSWLATGLYVGFGAAEMYAVSAGIRRHRPRRRWAWRLLAGGVGSYSIANVLQFGWPLFHHGELPFPSLADAFFLSAYLLFAAGLVDLIRARSGSGESLGSVIDAAIVTVCTGLVAWNLLLSDLDPGGHAGTLGDVVSVSYPSLDLALLALLARMTMTR